MKRIDSLIPVQLSRGRTNEGRKKKKREREKLLRFEDIYKEKREERLPYSLWTKREFSLAVD